jgi:LysM repeat protein
MNAKIKIIRLVLGCLVMIMTGCQSAPRPSSIPTEIPTRSGMLPRYQTATPRLITMTPPAFTAPVFSPVPSITLTPRTHVVKAGEDMAGIALRYRIPLKDLMAANATVTPRAMKIGTVLVIPGNGVQVTGGAQPTPTPPLIILTHPVCYPDLAGGAWCFGQARNQGGQAIINLTVTLRLMDTSGQMVTRQNSTLLLDLLPPGATLPVAAYFSAPLPTGFQVDLQILSALPATSTTDHYLATTIRDQKIEISPDGSSAAVRGKVDLTNGQGDATQLAVLAVAYTSSGVVAGVRRWDCPQPPHSGQSVEFLVWVYGSSIQRVEVFAEARK